MAKRAALFCVPALVLGIVVGLAPAATATLPAGTTPVVVTAGADQSGINADLHPAGSISGTVTAAAGGPLTGTITAYLGSTVVSAGPISNGSYLLGGLPPSDTGYAVCVNGNNVVGGNSSTGYQGRCYLTSGAFNGVAPPANAHLIKLVDGQQQANVNITLPSGAAIIGKVTTAGGLGIGNVSVLAKNRSSGAVFSALTSGSGRYSVIGLTPSAKGYSVCANPGFVQTGSTGYRPRCYQDVAWNGGKIPAGATPVQAVVGATTTGANIALSKGAAISGKVTDGSNGHPLGIVGVAAFSSAGAFLTSTSTNAHGTYTLRGLAASATDRVCVFPTAGSTPGISYRGECWKNVTWKGGALPRGTTSVTTTIGRIHTGISFKLTKVTVHLGTIDGTITAGVDRLQSAHVSLFSSGGALVDSADTDASGNYRFLSVKPSATGYRVCVQAADDTFAPATSFPTGGWAPRCFGNIAWDGLDVPTAATKFPMTPGQQKHGVDIAMQAGGAISGTTLQFGTATPAPHITVDVYTQSGGLLAQEFSGSVDGTYTVNNLAPSADGYIVCFDGRTAQSDAADWLPQCYPDVAWDGN